MPEPTLRDLSLQMVHALQPFTGQCLSEHTRARITDALSREFAEALDAHGMRVSVNIVQDSVLLSYVPVDSDAARCARAGESLIDPERVRHGEEI